MEIKTDNITALLQEQIKKFDLSVDVSEVGEVIEIGDGVARVSGLEKVMSSELVELPNDVYGMALNLEDDNVGVVLFGESSHVKEGDQVIVTWVPRTPVAGRPAVPHSGITYQGVPVNGNVYTWGEDVLVRSNYVVSISKDHPKDISCIVGCAVLTGAGAVLHTAHVRPGQSVAVFGCGGIGLCSIRMAAILEAYPIIAVDLQDDKLQLAKEFGATHIIKASKMDPIEAIQEITRGGVDYAFDAIGVPATNEQILPSTKAGGPGADNHGGTAVLIGLPGGDVTINTRLFVTGQRRYIGSLGATYPDKDFPMFLQWYEEGKFPLDRLITKRYNMNDINEACDSLKAGDILGRSIIEF